MSELRSNEFVFTMALLASAEHRRKNKRKSVCNKRATPSNASALAARIDY
jgi:hypothetical protein